MRKISVFLLAAFVLIGSTGFMVDQHFCQGELQHTAVLTKAASCHQTQSCHNAPAASQMACCSTGTSSDQEKGCCDNESDFVQVDLDYPCFDCDFELERTASIAAASFLRQFPCSEKMDSQVRFINHIPPPITLDPQSYLQVFRC